MKTEAYRYISHLDSFPLDGDSVVGNRLNHSPLPLSFPVKGKELGRCYFFLRALRVLRGEIFPITARKTSWDCRKESSELQIVGFLPHPLVAVTNF